MCRTIVPVLAIALIHCAPPTYQGRSVAEAATSQEPASEPAAAKQTPESVPQASPPETSDPTPPPQSTLAWKGVDLYMHDYGPTDGRLRDPTFWIHAEQGQRAGAGRTWSLQQTRAVIYREADENLVVEAAIGQFDEEAETARLSGRVRLSTGRLRVDLEELVWDNTKGLATSDRPVRVTDSETQLVASGILINPHDDTIVLNEGSGVIQLLETEP